MTAFSNMWRRALSAPIVFLMIAMPFFSSNAAADEKIVASVNGKGISQKEFNRQVEIIQQRSAQSGQVLTEENLVKAKENILENMIAAEVLYQESQRQKIKVEPDTVEEKVNEVKGQFEDEAAFKERLKNMGLTEKEMRQQIKRGMAINQLIDEEVRDNVKVSEAEAKKFYDENPKLFQQPEQVRASHILIKVDKEATEKQKSEARDKVKEIQKKIKAGEDFGELAKTYSEGPSSKRGGDLNYFSRGQMVKPFENAAFDMEIGEVSDTVETRFGYHLIKVVDKKEGRTIPYPEVKDKLMTYLKNEKEKKQIQSYVEGLKASAQIERKI